MITALSTPDSPRNIEDESRQPLAATGRRRLDPRLIVALAAGTEVRQIAKDLAVSERTIYRRLKNQAFRQRISQFRDRMTYQAVGRLAAASGAAVNTLVALLSDADPRVRLCAAKTILEQGIKQRDLNEFGERLATLEAQAKCFVPKK
jgi:transposase